STRRIVPAAKSRKLPALRAEVGEPGKPCPRLFLLLRFRQLPALLESGPNPACFSGVGYTVGHPLKAAHSGSQGATGAFVFVSTTGGRFPAPPPDVVPPR